MDNTITAIDDYIKLYPQDYQVRMNELRSLIKRIAPKAKEKMSWGMPTFDYYGNLVHFASCKGYIGFYPGDSAVEIFNNQLTHYVCTKASIHLPMDEPLPVELIITILKFRIIENEQDAIRKKH